MTFEEWFKTQYFYQILRFNYGNSLFIKDDDVYRVMAVQTAYVAWKMRNTT